METSVDFKSDLFTPFLPDESQVNPCVFGAELAYWLSQKLATIGVITSYPEYEDWGWFIEFIVEDNEYILCCSNTDENGKEWGTTVRWTNNEKRQYHNAWFIYQLEFNETGTFTYYCGPRFGDM